MIPDINIFCEERDEKKEYSDSALKNIKNIKNQFLF